MVVSVRHREKDEKLGRGGNRQGDFLKWVPYRHVGCGQGRGGQVLEVVEEHT